MLKIWLNDRLVPEKEAVISVFDHGFLYGDGVYETLLARKSAVLKMNDHLKRLERSASLIELLLPYKRDELSDIVYRTIEGNKLSDAYIRITLSRGPGPIGLDPALCPVPTLVIICRPFVPQGKEIYRKGVKIMIPCTKRNPREAVDPGIKSLNFLNNVLAKIEAKKAEAFEAVMLNHKGHVTEGTISNVFIVKKGALLTPSLESGILEGITRNAVLDLARKKGIAVSETQITKAAFYGADEVFITNTSMGVMPVRQVDHVRFEQREVTDVLSREYGKWMDREVMKESRRRIAKP